MQCAIYYRSVLEEKHMQVKSISFLYSAYEPWCYYFEVIETVRKLFLTAGLIFFRPGTGSQIVFSLLISIASMRVYAHYKPFVKDDQDAIAEAAQWSQFFILFGALLIRLNMDNESLQDKAYFDFMMVVVNFMPILIPVLQQLAIVKRMKSVPVLKTIITQISAYFGREELTTADAAKKQLDAIKKVFGTSKKKNKGTDEEEGSGALSNPLNRMVILGDEAGVQMTSLNKTNPNAGQKKRRSEGKARAAAFAKSASLQSSFSENEGVWYERLCTQGPNTGKVYYNQPKTGQVSWTRPEGVEIKKAEEGDKAPGATSNVAPSSQPPPAPSR